MSDSTKTPNAGGTTTEPTAGAAGEGTTGAANGAATGGENRPAGGSRTFSQEELNSLLAKERRDTEAKFADYGELAEKAARLDAMEEERKSELEKANDAAAKAEERAVRAEAELQAVRAEQERAAAVRAAADKYGVDAETLSRMGGDVDENAAFLQARAPKQPAYPQVRDNGEVPGKSLTKEDIESIEDPERRVRMRAEHMDLYR